MGSSEHFRRLYRREHSYDEEKENNRGLMNKILDFKEEGMTIDEISKKLGISSRKVKALLKAYKIQIKERIEKYQKPMTKEQFLKWAHNNGIIS